MPDSHLSPDDGILIVGVEEDGDALVLRPLGDLGIETTHSLDAELRKAIASDASVVFLDLGGVSFIDSTGVRLLVFAAAHSRGNGSRLRMMRGSVKVQQVIELTGVDHTLPFID
jgi:anti-anti-sigma factor